MERIPLNVLPVTSCDGCGVCCEEQAGLPITWYTVLEPDAPLTPELRAEIDKTARRWNGLGVWQGPGEGAPCRLVRPPGATLPPPRIPSRSVPRI